MNKLKAMIASMLLVPVLGFGVAASLPASVSAASCVDNNGKVSVRSGADCAKSDSQKKNIGVVIKDITNVLLFIIGAVAVIMIIVGGLRYVTSNGDSNQVTAAKNTILYGVIGVIIALLAYAIVNFVISSFSTNNGNEPAADASETE